MKEAIKTIQLKLSFGRLQLIIASIVIVLAVVGILFYKFGVYSKAYAYGLRAEVKITISDSADNTIKLPAEVSLTNTRRAKYKASGTANDKGEAVLKNLVKGTYSVQVKYKGYDDFSATLTLLRGKDNAVGYSLKKTPPETVEVTGTITNQISEVALEGAQVAIGETKTITDKEGKFALPGIITGDYDVKITAKGYLDKTSKVTITKNEANVSLALTPEGKVFFVSNRDKGKRGIYVSNYDGSDAKPLIARSGETEDLGPVTSPDFKKVAFLSTREGIKENGNTINTLYVVDIDGRNLTKVSDHVHFNPIWTSNSKSLVYTTYKNANNSSQNEAYVYDIAKKSSAQIYSFTNGSYSDLRLNESNTKIAYAYGQYSNASFGLYVYDIAGAAVSRVAEEESYINLLQFKGDSELIYSIWNNSKNNYFSFNLSDNSKNDIQYEAPKRITIKSPDGKSYAFAETRDGKTNIYITDAKGANERKLTSVDTASGSPYWSLNSKLLFFNSFKEGESALYVVSLDGGKEKKVIDVTQGGYNMQDGMGGGE